MQAQAEPKAMLVTFDSVGVRKNESFQKNGRGRSLPITRLRPKFLEKQGCETVLRI